MNVRSAMVAMLALALSLLAPQAASATDPEPRVTIATLPPGTTVEQIAAAVPGISPGVLSAGLSRVSASQTYLDIGQGTRLFTSLYKDDLPPLYVAGGRVPGRLWDQVLERAEESPANLDPGLLASERADEGIPVRATPGPGEPALLGVDSEGRIGGPDGCVPGVCPGVTISSTSLFELPRIARRIRGQDLLIVLERPPPVRTLLAVGIAGDGFGDGNLTSASTRREGYVLSTDLLPTILARYGIAVPDDVAGREIETTGEGPDAATVTDLAARLGEVSSRRWPVLGVNLLIWLGLVAAAALLSRGRVFGRALVVLAVAVALVPAILLIGAATSPSVVVERLLVGLGAPLLALAALGLMSRLPGDRASFGAFALGAAASIGATAVDVVLGSPLTALSLIGPNLSIGVRFFGIGNELEASLAALLLLGVAAGVRALDPPDPRRAVAIATVVATVLAVIVFAPGRFGADVGAAITLPAGAAAVVIVALRLRAGRAVLVLAAPVVALAALVVIDLVSGGDSHLSSSVLSAGGLDELGDVFERRVTLSARTFPRSISSPWFLAALLLIALAIVFRKRISDRLALSPPVGIGVVGAIAATVIGTLANDSGALLLMVGTGFIAVFCGLAYGADDR
jgi:hypothetical protein